MKFWSQGQAWLAAVALLTANVAAQPTAAVSTVDGASVLSVRQANANATAAATAKAQAAAQLLASMPECGRNCLLQGIATSPCELSDIACSCSNATITAEVEVCVQTSCMIKNQLASKNATSTLCSVPQRDDTKAVSYTGVIGGVLAVVTYALRMISRCSCFGGSFGWDDLVITIAIFEIVPLSVFSVILANLGLGKDIWTVPFENITAILKVYYFDEDLYLTALSFVKISMLLFYLRIFPQKWFRISCYVTMAACAGYGIAFLLVSVFQCRPINFAWHHWDGEHEGSCNDINAQGWTSAAFNVILDIIVLALPMPVLAKLQLNKRKKFFVCLMFSVGFVVTIVSILRLQVLVQFGGTTNFTWHYRSVGYWSTSEIDLAVICACMPGMRALISFVLPKMMGESTRGNSPAPTGYGRYATDQSGMSYEKKSRASRASRDPTKDEKDFIPLVEVKDFNQGPSDHDDKAWPLASATPQRASSPSLGRTISMDT